ncbi:MAG: hypothetical protein M1818_000655 [Claussenomyces sp. TS43310]|nr:MAG: hypothetical protein M1818_000655 [Claussenomyces sp. TS43310]
MHSLQKLAAQARNQPKDLAPKKAVNQKPAASFLKSNEYISHSDLESETESEEDSTSEEEQEDQKSPKVAPPAATTNGTSTKAAPPVKNANGTPTKATSTSSSSDSEEEGSESDRDSDSQVSMESSSGSESQVEVVDDDDESPSSPTASVGPARKSDATSTAPVVASKPSAVFIPPPGFEGLTKTRGNTRPRASEMFHASSISGKQVWYITAPASVPISAIKKVSLEDVKDGKPALSHNGQDYGFVQNEVEDKRFSRIMLPDDLGSSYHLEKKSLDQTLHLQQMIQLPNQLSPQVANAQAISKATVPAKKPIRQQPEGLQMRFRPIGVWSGKPGVVGSNASSEKADVEPESRRLPPLTQSESDLTQTSSDTSTNDDSDREMVDAPVFKSKTDLQSISSNDSASRASKTPSDKNDELDAAPMSAKKPKTISSKQAPRKRKLSDMTTTTTPNSSFTSPKTSGTQPKKTKIQAKPKVTNSGQIQSNNTRTISTTSMLRPPSPAPNHVKETPILPPRSSSEAFSSQISKSSNRKHIASPAQNLEPPSSTSTLSNPKSTKKKVEMNTQSKKLNGQAHQLSKEPEPPRTPQSAPRSKQSDDSGKTLEERIAAIDPSLGKKDREKLVKQLKKNQSSRLSKAKQKGRSAADKPKPASQGS